MMTSDPTLNLAIAATFSAGPVQPAVAFWMDELGLPARIALAAYNQLFQELLDPASMLSSSTHGVNIVLLRLEDWLAASPEGGHRDEHEAGWRRDISQKVVDFIDALSVAVRRSSVSWLLVACPASPAIAADPERATFLAELEERLASGLSDIGGIDVVKSATLTSAYPVAGYFDAHADAIAHVPYTTRFFAALATMVARRIYSLKEPGYKAMVVDCDNVLWTGICGEDGPDGVEIDRDRQQIQQQLVALHDRGILLCLCSRNNEADVRAVFQHRLEMRVQLRHFASFRCNWARKSDNITDLARELNLSPDAFVFIDDDAVECAEVRASRPDVLTIQLPKSAAAAAKLLRNLWVFDGGTSTAEANSRTEFFRQNVVREQARQHAPTLSDFLARLGLRIQALDASAHLSRVSELTYRTNQFNLTTIRRSEADIGALGRRGGEGLAFRVEDRFGDYGIVGVLLFTATAEALVTDTFLLSCRALGRGVEHRMLATLGERARARGLGRVDLSFRPSGSNQPALDFLRSVAADFEESQSTGKVFRIPVEVAAAARYRPNEHDRTERKGQGRADFVTPPRTDARAKSALLVSIATDLSDPAQVEEQIAARTRARPSIANAYVAPCTPAEQTIAAIFGTLLGIEEIGIHDNFFQIGGHSLLAMQVIFKIREAFDVELSARDLYDGQFTAAQLATKVARLQLKTASSAQIGEVLDKLSALSDEEVRELLAGAAGMKGEAPK